MFSCLEWFMGVRIIMEVVLSEDFMWIITDPGWITVQIWFKDIVWMSVNRIWTNWRTKSEFWIEDRIYIVRKNLFLSKLYDLSFYRIIAIDTQNIFCNPSRRGSIISSDIGDESGKNSNTHFYNFWLLKNNFEFFKID